MSFPPFILPSFDRALTQLCNQLSTRVISSYICTLKTHICTRYLARRVIISDTRSYTLIPTYYLSDPYLTTYPVCMDTRISQVTCCVFFEGVCALEAACSNDITATFPLFILCVLGDRKATLTRTRPLV